MVFFSVPIGFSAVPAVPPGLFGGTSTSSYQPVGRHAARAPAARGTAPPARAPPQHTAGRGEEGVFALALYSRIVNAVIILLL